MGCTETVADIANDNLDDKVATAKARHTSHCFDIVSEIKPMDCDTPFTDAASASTVEAASDTTDTSSPIRKPIKYWDIYVNDFGGLVQRNKW